MQIYVGKNGQQLGPFSLEEINRKLADRTFAGTDLAWYEGAAGWAPLSGVAGVVLPSAVPTPAAPTPTPAATPAPAQPAPAPAAAPVRSNAPIVQRPASSYRTLAVVSWILLGVTLVISVIPFVGCGSWIIVWPVAVAAIIMGIIVLTRGGTVMGALIILGAILIVPLSFLGQFASLALVSQLSGDRKYETQIKENLRMLELAKTQFGTDTKAADGTPLTMANLTSYLSGKEIKPVVGEQYDPRPMGEAPTATLPATKTLGKFKGGDVLTADAIEKDLALFSYQKSTWTSFGTSPTPAVSPATSPKVSAAPSVSASPKPSLSPKPFVSPKPTSTPHSLISPRQSVAPDETPSSSARPSASAKFAPRNGPRSGPREAPSQPEQSGGLRQGKRPPGTSPSPTPEDDDD